MGMDPHLAKLFLLLLTLGFAMGFASGYGVRAGISYYRRLCKAETVSLLNNAPSRVTALTGATKFQEGVCARATVFCFGVCSSDDGVM